MSGSSGFGRERPAVDERLVAPESRYEVEDGKVVYVAPADEPHASRHSKVSAIVEACVADGYDVASDMLTRLTETDDAAPDVSVFPVARDPATGGRKTEELAFEVVSTERLGHAGQKAAKLIARGVRRVFAVDVERQRALEWSPALGTWSMLADSDTIADAVLAAPLPVADLVRAAKSDDPVARALLAKQNPGRRPRSVPRARDDVRHRRRSVRLTRELQGRRGAAERSERDEERACLARPSGVSDSAVPTTGRGANDELRRRDGCAHALEISTRRPDQWQREGDPGSEGGLPR
jgi:hypothetical protein